VTRIRFENGSTVTISHAVIQVPSPTLDALLDALAATLPGYGGIPFVLDEDFNILRGLIEETTPQSRWQDNRPAPQKSRRPCRDSQCGT